MAITGCQGNWKKNVHAFKKQPFKYELSAERSYDSQII